jgi:small nuclear ribonucleoprotein (snRNP)-like protein
MVKLLVKLRNGEEMKGELLSFNANLPAFHVIVEKDSGRTHNVTVSMDSVKAVFFLKKEDGADSLIRNQTIEQSVFAGTLGFRLDVEFKDGEMIHGSANKFSPNDKGFYLVPFNPAGRYDRIYINALAVERVVSRRLMGKILVEQQKITATQLNHAIQHQEAQREKKIGTILKEHNIINSEQLEESLQKQKKRTKFLGEILLEAGYITEEQLENALRIQHENRKKKLGQILVELQYLCPNDICIALSTQLQLPWADLSSANIPVEIATVLSEDVIKRLDIIPIERQDDTLVIATSDPQAPTLKSEISRYTNLKVALVVAYEGYIEFEINRLFPKKD